MASLGVEGSPDDWQDAAQAIGTIFNSLQDELHGADSAGGTGLVGQHWVGPVADQYRDVWQQRHQRYQDLLDIVRRTPAPVDAFGSQLNGFQKRAQQLEGHYTSHGLHLTLDGRTFQLPPYHASLTQELKTLLEALLKEAELAVEMLWNDIQHAVNDLEGALKPLASDLEDLAFALRPLGIYWAGKAVFDWTAGWVDRHEAGVDQFEHIVIDPVEHFADNLEKKNHEVSERLHSEAGALKGRLKQATEDVERDASDLNKSYRSDVAQALKDTERSVRDLDVVKYGGKVLLGAAILINGMDTYNSYEKDHHNLLPAVEQNAGGWAGLAAGVVVGAVLGPGLIPFIAAVGVGIVAQYSVQYVVDHRKGIGRYMENQFSPVAE